MGIRKEIKDVLRRVDVCDAHAALDAIEKIVDRPKPEVEVKPHLIVTEDEVESKGGISKEHAVKLLVKAAVLVAKDVVGEADCQDCPNKEGCPDAK